MALYGLVKKLKNLLSLIIEALTLCFLMYFPIHVCDCPLCTLRGHNKRFLNHVFLSLTVVLILANSAEPDEMQHDAAFHLGLHCLQKYLFRGFQYERVNGIVTWA